MVLLNDTFLGRDVDELFGYTTKKVVWVRDRWIGILYYALIFLVLLWVFGVQIFLRNEQFLRMDVKGLARMWASHPTVGGCEPTLPDCLSDYRTFRELSYCDVYPGLGEGAAKGPCKYEDRTSIMPEGEVDNKLFFPTAVEVITEKRTCKPAQANGYSCKNEYQELPGSDCMKPNVMCKERAGKLDQFYYVADVKNYVIQLTSSYEQGSVHGTSLDHPGSIARCDKLERKPNVTRTWPERLEWSHDNDCDSGEVKYVKIPCAEGVPCARDEAFDFAKNTGMKQAADEVKHRAKEAGEAVGVKQRDEEGDGEDAGDEDEAPPEDQAEEKPTGGSGGSGFAQLPGFAGLQEARGGLPHGHVHRRHRHISHEKPAGSRMSNALTHSDQVIKIPAGRAWAGLHSLVSKKKEHADEVGVFGGLVDSLGLGNQLRSGLGMPRAVIPKPVMEHQPPEYTSPWGDMFKIGRLMQLAGADLDGDYNFDGWTTRQSGTVIEIRAVYNNLYPFLSSFGYKQVEYHYEISELPLPYMSRTRLSEIQPDDYPESRNYEIRHGVMVWFKVAGAFGVFNVVYLLLMLVTAFALFATATTITDLVSLYLHPRKDNFFHLKYEVSPNFSDMWECSVCKYCNWPDSEACEGVPAWKCPKHEEKCNNPRPVDWKRTLDVQRGHSSGGTVVQSP